MTREIQTAGRDVGWCPQGFRVFLTTLVRIDPEVHRRSFDSIQEHHGRCGQAIKMLADWVRNEIVSLGCGASAAQRFLELPDREQLRYVRECGAALMNMPDCPVCAEWMIENCTDFPPGCTHGYSVSVAESLPEGG